MKKASVYTRGGDGGESQLLSVGRVSKDHLRLTVYGDTDELNIRGLGWRTTAPCAITDNYAFHCDANRARTSALT